jgi:predicted ATPase/DNA-binding winged helix-turn-helix (wHTH) protein
MRSPLLSRPAFYVLDVENQCLWATDERIALTPKTFAVLRYLVEHRERLVTKEALLNAVWPGARVEEGQVRQYMTELRRLLRDDAESPLFIQTVHGSGYRLIGDIRIEQSPHRTSARHFAPNDAERPHLAGRTATEQAPVGREAELAQLRAQLELAYNKSEPQLCIVTGEAGIGKTTVLTAFVRQAASSGSMWLLRGQCTEQQHESEPYLPILRALESVCDTPDGVRAIEVLRDHAPHWLAELGGRATASTEESRSAPLLSNGDRKLREFCRFMETLAAQRLTVLWLEDLHWADDWTLDLVTTLARSTRAVCMMILLSSRSAETYPDKASLQRLVTDARARRVGRELALPALGETAVTQYLLARWPNAPAQLAPLLHQHTEGNPLFMVSAVEHLLSQASSDAVAPDVLISRVPETLRGMIEYQIVQLRPEDQQLLEVASVAGRVFSAAALAAALSQDLEGIEQHCGVLARRGHLLRRVGEREWPDGTLAEEFEFVHSFPRQVLYQRLPLSTRTRLHQAIAERLEAGYPNCNGEIAMQLAHHFELGRDRARAVHYLSAAAETAPRHEAQRILSRGLAILLSLPETVERNRMELQVRTALGTALLHAERSSSSVVVPSE